MSRIQTRSKRCVGAIALLDNERTLAAAINFDFRARLSGEAAQRSADAVCALLTSLVERNAIPDHRMRFFTDPALNVGGHGKSRKQVFEKNNCYGDDIIRHAHFLPYFRYMVFGTELPDAVVEAFCEVVDDCGQVTSGDIIPLATTSKRLTREHRLTPSTAAEEFYKLGLDLGFDPGDALAFRNAVKQIRPR